MNGEDPGDSTPGEETGSGDRSKARRQLGKVSTAHLAQMAGLSKDAAAQVSAAVAAAAKIDTGWVSPLHDLLGPAARWEPEPLEKQFPELLDPELLRFPDGSVHHEIADAAQAQVERLDAMTELLSRQALAQSALLDVQRRAMEQSAASQKTATRLTWLSLCVATAAVIVSLPSAIATMLSL